MTRMVLLSTRDGRDRYRAIMRTWTTARIRRLLRTSWRDRGAKGMMYAELLRRRRA